MHRFLVIDFFDFPGKVQVDLHWRDLSRTRCRIINGHIWPPLNLAVPNQSISSHGRTFGRSKLHSLPNDREAVCGIGGGYGTLCMVLGWEILPT